MKVNRVSVLMLMPLLSFFLAPQLAPAQAPKFSAQEPVLITSAGQSADTQMVKVLADKSKIQYKFLPSANENDLEGMKSVMVVIGGSTKGMGAAGIDAEKEASRVQRLIAKAKGMKIPIIGLHIGGKARRGDLSDRFIKTVAPQSSYLLVVKEGDSDELFTKTASQHHIPILRVDKIVEIQAHLKAVYGK